MKITIIEITTSQIKASSCLQLVILINFFTSSLEVLHQVYLLSTIKYINSTQLDLMDFELNNPAQSGSILVFGGSGIDYIAQVCCFPQRDSKIRTQAARILVGGNAANTAAGKWCVLLHSI